jgi:ubiquinone/menaquinone biosynthesis C-methylase UbiE
MKTNIQKQYDNFSDTYSTNINYDQQSNDMFFKQITFALENQKILDIGCGDGSDLYQLSQKGAIVYGIDPSSEFVKSAKEKNPQGIIKEGVAEAIPFSDEMFDIVVSKWALQTCVDVPQALAEAARVLKSGGYLVYLTKHPWMQWMGKVRDYGHGVDYYEQKIVTSHIFGGKITLKEPSHTMGEYLNNEFFEKFEVLNFYEGTDFPASEQINNDVYPTYFVLKARKK